MKLPTGEEYRDSWLYRIAPVDDERDQQIVINSSISAKYFAMTVLGETFSDPMTGQDDEIWSLVEDDCIPKTCIMAWRGKGKSNIAMAMAMHSALFRKDKYIIWLGSDLKAAQRMTENIKTHLMTNEWIQRVFRIGKPQQFEAMSGKFSVSYWMLADPITNEPFCCIEPRGVMQTNRGFNRVIGRKNYRATLVIADDVEDDDDVQNDEIREECRQKFHAAVSNIINTKLMPNPETQRWDAKHFARGVKPWRFFYVDTPKHQDANIVHLLADSDWVSRVYPMARVGEDGLLYSNVPECLSDDQVRAQLAHATEHNYLDVFYREKMVQPSGSPDAQAYTKDMFVPYEEDGLNLNHDPLVKRFLIVDPARTSKGTSDPTAILGVAVHPKRGTYLRDGVNKRLKPEAIWDAAFKMAAELNTRIIFVEDNGLHEHLEYEVVNAARLAGVDITWKFLKARAAPTDGNFGKGKNRAKIARGGSMLGDYRRHRVYHSPKIKNTAFESQLLSYPSTQGHDDARDTIGYIPQALRELEFAFDAEVKTTETQPTNRDMRQNASLGARIRRMCIGRSAGPL